MNYLEKNLTENVKLKSKLPISFVPSLAVEVTTILFVLLFLAVKTLNRLVFYY